VTLIEKFELHTSTLQPRGHQLVGGAAT
jgi:hypothetical protein